MTGTAQRRSATHTTSTALGRGETTSPTFSHLPIRLSRSWFRPRHLNLRVMELFGLCHNLEEAMSWHSAAKHVPMVSAPLRLRKQSVQFGSGTVPHQLENTPRAIPSTQTQVNDFQQTHKQYHKSRNAHCKTSCRRQLLRRLCEETFVVTTNARHEHTQHTSCTSKPLPAGRLQ